MVNLHIIFGLDEETSSQIIVALYSKLQKYAMRSMLSMLYNVQIQCVPIPPPNRLPPDLQAS